MAENRLIIKKAALLVISFFLNNFAWIANSTASLPIGTIIFVLFIFVLVTVPLAILGGINGKIKNINEDSFNEIDHKEKKTRSVAGLPLYLRPELLIIAAGFLPFQYF